MKPFDLEKAKAGAKVVTRDGTRARMVCFDLKGRQPIGVAVEHRNEDGTVIEVLRSCGKDGRYYTGTAQDGDTRLDLFMAPEKRYVAVWLKNNGDAAVHPTTFKSKEHCLDALHPFSGFQIVEFEI